MLDEAVYYTRMAFGLRKLSKVAPLADPEDAIRLQLANRQTNFLELARTAVFDNPRTPYREMLRLAGCEFGDLARAVQQKGLEPALESLRAAGVYLTHDEFKCTQPIVRAGREIPSDETCFHNPTVQALYRGRSSGSRSRRTPTPYSLEFLLHWEAQNRVRLRALDSRGKAYIVFRPILPAPQGLRATLPTPHAEFMPACWFAEGGSLSSSWYYRIATHAMARFSRVRWNNWIGAGTILPTYLPPNDFLPIAQWIARRKAEGVSTLAHLTPSNAVRIVGAAMDRRLDIAGTIFLSGSEGTSDAKRARVKAAGAEIHASYPMSEIGYVGSACRHMTESNSVHLFEDSVAVLARRQRLPFAEEEASVLLFTTLLPWAGQVLINADMGDTGVLAPTHCDCLFSQLGLRRQICNISSHSKLTGYGVTLVGTDMLKVLEEFLPARLGGLPCDYQLMQGDDRGETRISLRVSPRIGAKSTEQVKAVFLEGVKCNYGGAVAVRLWKHAEAVEVIFAEPVKTPAGKVLPLHLEKPAGRTA